MVIKGKTAWADKLCYTIRSPYEIRVDIDENANEFVVACVDSKRTKGESLAFTVVNRAGSVVAEYFTGPIPGFWESWMRTPKYSIIKDTAGKEPTITINFGQWAWSAKRISWDGFETKYYRPWKRHTRVESLGISWDLDAGKFRAVCEKPSSDLAPHMLVALLYDDWISYMYSTMS